MFLSMTWNYIYTCEMYKRDLLMQNVSRLCCFHFLWEFIWCVGIYRYVMGYNMCWIIFIFCYEIYFLFLLFFYLKWNKIIKLNFGNYNLLTCRGPHHPLVFNDSRKYLHHPQPPLPPAKFAFWRQRPFCIILTPFTPPILFP